MELVKITSLIVILSLAMAGCKARQSHDFKSSNSDPKYIPIDWQVKLLADKSVVMIRASAAGIDDKEFNGDSIGTGFVIDPRGYLLTNYHVVKDAPKHTDEITNLQVFVPDVAQDGTQNPPNIYPATTVVTDKECDLALLKLHNTYITKFHPVAIRHLTKDAFLKEKTEVFTIGHPYGKPFQFSQGRIAEEFMVSIKDYAPECELFVSELMTVNPGNSGGPLFDVKGNVMGMVSAKSLVKDRVGFSLNISQVLDRLYQELSTQQESKLHHGLKFALDKWGKVRVLGFSELHDRGDLRPGDIIESIDVPRAPTDIRITSPLAAELLFEDAMPGDPVVVELVRESGGKRRPVRYQFTIGEPIR